MDDATKEKIIQQIVKQHKLLIDKDDPVFAVATMVEELLTENIARFELLLKMQSSAIEESTHKVLYDARKIADTVIMEKTTDIVRNLDELNSDLSKTAIHEIEKTAAENKLNQIKNNTAQIKSNQHNFIIAGVSFATLLIGVTIGLLLKS